MAASRSTTTSAAGRPESPAAEPEASIEALASMMPSLLVDRRRNSGLGALGVVPGDVLRLLLRLLCARDVLAVACASPALRGICTVHDTIDTGEHSDLLPGDVEMLCR